MAETKKTKSAGGGKKASASASAKKDQKTEEKQVKSEDLLDEIKKIVHEGNVRRVIVRSKEGRELVNFPLTAGILGVMFLPLFAAVAAIVGLAKEFTVVIERHDD
ncbi:MAG TPA: DUF4342 domain-containing protein [Fimbriimonadaceae bacterium]|nr:DUF4342 domain-containing protein [Fimbriimonadaceae bacterium]